MNLNAGIGMENRREVHRRMVRRTTTTATGSVRPIPICSTPISLRHHRRSRGQRRWRDQASLRAAISTTSTSGTGTRCASSPCSERCSRRVARRGARVGVRRRVQASTPGGRRTNSIAKSPTGKPPSCATMRNGASASPALGNAPRTDGLRHPRSRSPCRTRSSHNYMQPWTHGALYNTSDFNVGMNNGWALPNYRMLDQAVNIEYFEKELGGRPAGGSELAGWTPRNLTEETDRPFPGSEWPARDARQPALQRRRALHRHGSERRRHRQRPNTHPTGVRQRSYVRRNTRLHKVLPSFNMASELGQGLVLRIAASKDHDAAAAG